MSLYTIKFDITGWIHDYFGDNSMSLGMDIKRFYDRIKWDEVIRHGVFHIHNVYSFVTLPFLKAVLV